MKKTCISLFIVFFGIFLLRFPSLFEPFWYGDEGIFAAVASNLNQGGVLYKTAWDNKPLMIYLTYAAIFKYFGVSMFWLRMGALVSVLITAAAIYEIGRGVYGERKGVIVAGIFGVLSSLRIVEGNLALTEIFMILPISLAMLVAIKRKFDYPSLFAAGVLFAVGSLYKQVGVMEAAALGIFLFLYTNGFSRFVKKALVLSCGFGLVYLFTILYFAQKHLLSDYIFAAYTYYRIYLGESPRYAVLINILKYMPILAAVGYGLIKKYGLSLIRHPDPASAGEGSGVDLFDLVLLWTAFSFLGSYFSGRTYGHYLVQATVAVSLLLAGVNLHFGRLRSNKFVVGFAILYFIPLVLLTQLLFSNFLSGGPVNQIKYFRNFLDFATGRKNLTAYNNFFDSNVNTIMALNDFFASRGDHGTSAYIWGDMSWLYAVGDLRNPSRYVTSFHVFGVPNGKEEVAKALDANKPKYIIKGQSSIGYFGELEKLLSYNYTFVLQVENASVFRRKD